MARKIAEIIPMKAIVLILLVFKKKKEEIASKSHCYSDFVQL